MRSLDHRFDAVVIGSGAAGSVAVRELTERGLDVLLLEAGRDLTDADFTPPPPKAPRPLGMDLDLRAKAMLAGQLRQARRSFFSETSNRFLVNDRENPYSAPLGSPYLWIRARILGGRLNTYGRVLQRMSDVDFKAASRDGYGHDWPISYADLEPSGFEGVLMSEYEGHAFHLDDAEEQVARHLQLERRILSSIA